jgi:hypothetical protein
MEFHPGQILAAACVSVVGSRVTPSSTPRGVAGRVHAAWAVVLRGERGSGKPISFLAGAAVVPLTALALAATAGTARAAKAQPTVNGEPVTVSVANSTLGVRSTRLGRALVGARGHTLYLFKKDSGTKSAASVHVPAPGRR